MSVRDAAEAAAALRGGAAVIDVKQPARGALGAPDIAAVDGVLEIVAGTRPVTVAAGDLDGGTDARVEALGRDRPIAAVKIGLGRETPADWVQRVRSVAERVAPGVDTVLCAYADRPAGAPGLDEVVAAAATLGLGWVLIDTADKEAGGLFAHLDENRLSDAIRDAASLGISIALAGRLEGGALARAARLRPALVGVRGAACRGGRDGTIETRLVAAAVDRTQLAPAADARHDSATPPNDFPASEPPGAQV